MLRRSFVLMCLVSIAAPMGAQSSALSGTWTGELTPTGATRSRAVTLDLVADRSGKVTGTMAGMPQPADVKAGTFDAKSGALKLELGPTGDSAVLMVLEGKVVKDTATGKLTAEGRDGDFKLTKKK